MFQKRVLFSKILLAVCLSVNVALAETQTCMPRHPKGEDLLVLLRHALEKWKVNHRLARAITKDREAMFNSFVKLNHDHLRDHFFIRYKDEIVNGQPYLENSHSVFEMDFEKVIFHVEEALKKAVEAVGKTNKEYDLRMTIPTSLKTNLRFLEDNLVIKRRSNLGFNGVRLNYKVPNEIVGVTYHSKHIISRETQNISIIISSEKSTKYGKIVSLFPVDKMSSFLIVAAPMNLVHEKNKSIEALTSEVNQTALEIVEWSVALKGKQIKEGERKIWDVLSEFALELLFPAWLAPESMKSATRYDFNQTNADLEAWFSFLDHKEKIISLFESVGLKQCSEAEYFSLFFSLVKPVVESALPFEFEEEK